MRKIFLTLFSIIFFITLLTGLLNYKLYLNKEIEIQKGSSTYQIAENLENNNIILNRYLFLIYALLKKEHLKAGVYEFKGNYSVIDVYNKIAKGEIKLKLFTIVPGDDLIDIAEKLEKENIIKKREFLDYVFNKENVKKFGLVGDSFEGYFPPESYAIGKNETPESLTKKFLEIFKERYLPYKGLIEKKDYSDFYKSKISFYEAMIIASMIEKETFVEEEKPTIAGVIFNRLKANMRLQIDPTVIYALKLANKWNGKLSKKDMVYKSPFNTYTTNGLPPTPICSFSLSSLKAVLNPVKTNYYYYVLSKDKSKHIFSENYKTHLKNIEENLK